MPAEVCPAAGAGRGERDWRAGRGAGELPWERSQAGRGLAGWRSEPGPATQARPAHTAPYGTTSVAYEMTVWAVMVTKSFINL